MPAHTTSLDRLTHAIRNVPLSATVTARIDNQIAEFWDHIRDLPHADIQHLIEKATSVIPAHLTQLHSINTPDLVISQFVSMLLRYILGDRGTVDLGAVSGLNSDELIQYDHLTEDDRAAGEAAISQIAFLKLNGGLGTTMGCTGPKSLIPIHDGYTFLDLILRQINTISTMYGSHIPLVLMNSYYTEVATRFAIGDTTSFLNLRQHQVPRIDVRTAEPVRFVDDPDAQWNPPGHGDIYAALAASGTLETLMRSGIRYLFVSNSDNLGATIDLKILGYMARNQLEFVMETTPKTNLDRKGGTLVRYNGRLFLLERAQVNPSQLDEFENIDRFKIFNTNNIWLDLHQIKRRLDNLDLALPLIVNPKTVNGAQIDQLESAMGAAINLFEKTASVVVPRDRFMPVKSVSDLLLLRSDVIAKHSDGSVRVSLERRHRGLPQITLGAAYHTVDQFNALVPFIPSLIDCRNLEVYGSVQFGPNIRITGDVRIESHTVNPFPIHDLHLRNEDIVISIDGAMQRVPHESPYRSV